MVAHVAEKPERMNWYGVLNIHQRATVQEIKKAYKQLALLHYPDKSGVKDAGKLLEVSLRMTLDTDKTLLDL